MWHAVTLSYERMRRNNRDRRISWLIRVLRQRSGFAQLYLWARVRVYRYPFSFAISQTVRRRVRLLDGNSSWQISVRTSVLIERTKRTLCRTMVRIIHVIGLESRNFRRNRDRNLDTIVTWFWISFQVDILRLWFIINIYEIFQHYKRYISTCMYRTSNVWC